MSASWYNTCNKVENHTNVTNESEEMIKFDIGDIETITSNIIEIVVFYFPEKVNDLSKRIKSNSFLSGYYLFCVGKENEGIEIMKRSLDSVEDNNTFVKLRELLDSCVLDETRYMVHKELLDGKKYLRLLLYGSRVLPRCIIITRRVRYKMIILHMEAMISYSQNYDMTGEFVIFFKSHMDYLRRMLRKTCIPTPIFYKLGVELGILVHEYETIWKYCDSLLHLDPVYYGRKLREYKEYARLLKGELSNRNWKTLKIDIPHPNQNKGVRLTFSEQMRVNSRIISSFLQWYYELLSSTPEPNQALNLKDTIHFVEKRATHLLKKKCDNLLYSYNVENRIFSFKNEIVFTVPENFRFGFVDLGDGYSITVNIFQNEYLLLLFNGRIVDRFNDTFDIIILGYGYLMLSERISSTTTSSVDQRRRFPGKKKKEISVLFEGEKILGIGYDNQGGGWGGNSGWGGGAGMTNQYHPMENDDIKNRELLEENQVSVLPGSFLVLGKELMFFKSKKLLKSEKIRSRAKFNLDLESTRDWILECMFEHKEYELMECFSKCLLNMEFDVFFYDTLTNPDTKFSDFSRTYQIFLLTLHHMNKKRDSSVFSMIPKDVLSHGIIPFVSEESVVFSGGNRKFKDMVKVKILLSMPDNQNSLPVLKEKYILYLISNETVEEPYKLLKLFISLRRYIKSSGEDTSRKSVVERLGISPKVTVDQEEEEEIQQKCRSGEYDFCSATFKALLKNIIGSHEQTIVFQRLRLEAMTFVASLCADYTQIDNNIDPTIRALTTNTTRRGRDKKTKELNSSRFHTVELFIDAILKMVSSNAHYSEKELMRCTFEGVLQYCLEDRFLREEKKGGVCVMPNYKERNVNMELLLLLFDTLKFSKNSCKATHITKHQIFEVIHIIHSYIKCGLSMTEHLIESSSSSSCITGKELFNILPERILVNIVSTLNHFLGAISNYSGGKSEGIRCCDYIQKTLFLIITIGGRVEDEEDTEKERNKHDEVKLKEGDGMIGWRLIFETLKDIEHPAVYAPPSRSSSHETQSIHSISYFKVLCGLLPEEKLRWPSLLRFLHNKTKSSFSKKQKSSRFRLNTLMKILFPLILLLLRRLSTKFGRKKYLFLRKEEEEEETEGEGEGEDEDDCGKKTTFLCERCKVEFVCISKVNVLRSEDFSFLCEECLSTSYKLKSDIREEEVEKIEVGRISRKLCYRISSQFYVMKFQELFVMILEKKLKSSIISLNVPSNFELNNDLLVICEGVLSFLNMFDNIHQIFYLYKSFLGGNEKESERFYQHRSNVRDRSKIRKTRKCELDIRLTKMIYALVKHIQVSFNRFQKRGAFSIEHIKQVCPILNICSKICQRLVFIKDTNQKKKKNFAFTVYSRSPFLKFERNIRMITLFYKTNVKLFTFSQDVSENIFSVTDLKELETKVDEYLNLLSSPNKNNWFRRLEFMCFFEHLRLLDEHREIYNDDLRSRLTSIICNYSLENCENSGSSMIRNDVIVAHFTNSICDGSLLFSPETVSLVIEKTVVFTNHQLFLNICTFRSVGVLTRHNSFITRQFFESLVEVLKTRLGMDPIHGEDFSYVHTFYFSESLSEELREQLLPTIASLFKFWVDNYVNQQGESGGDEKPVREMEQRLEKKSEKIRRKNNRILHFLKNFLTDVLSQDPFFSTKVQPKIGADVASSLVPDIFMGKGRFQTIGFLMKNLLIECKSPEKEDRISKTYKLSSSSYVWRNEGIIKEFVKPENNLIRIMEMNTYCARKIDDINKRIMDLLYFSLCLLEMFVVHNFELVRETINNFFVEYIKPEFGDSSSSNIESSSSKTTTTKTTSIEILFWKQSYSKKYLSILLKLIDLFHERNELESVLLQTHFFCKMIEISDERLEYNVEELVVSKLNVLGCNYSKKGFERDGSLYEVLPSENDSWEFSTLNNNQYESVIYGEKQPVDERKDFDFDFENLFLSTGNNSDGKIHENNGDIMKKNEEKEGSSALDITLFDFSPSGNQVEVKEKVDQEEKDEVKEIRVEEDNEDIFHF